MRLVRAARQGVIVGCTILLAGCVGALTWKPQRPHSAPPGGHYTVQRGDTLYAIAFHYGIDYHDLAAWNNISAPYPIYPGERLQLAPHTQAKRAVAKAHIDNKAPSSDKQAPPSKATSKPNTTSAPKPDVAAASRPTHWAWPVHGRLLSTFEHNSPLAKGIDIGGKAGEAIHAAAAGKVVYTGSGLIGYGKLIIIKHSSRYLSAYAHNEKVFVKEGEEVAQGKRIALMGTNRDDRAMLHFEIRYNGKPVNPLDYLPKQTEH